MKILHILSGIALASLIFLSPLHAQQTDAERLLRLSDQLRQEAAVKKAEAVQKATEMGWTIRTEHADGRITELMELDPNGMPLYYTTFNADGAALINSDELYTGGAAGLTLSGAGQTLGIWDGGAVLSTHQELTGRITQGDSPASTHWHATHVAGTMIASGAVSAAKGMSYAAALSAYDWDDDVAEMATEAAGGLKVSQHSYGLITGWASGSWSGNSGWHWWGNPDISQTEDYYWGFYSSEAQSWDNVAHTAPNYLIVKSAGNDRGEGITSGTHYVRNPSNAWAWEASTTVRQKDGGPTGYQSVAHSATAKNILTVGAVSNTTAMSTFSGWGPTDDGRIKPDIVAKGVSVYSSHDASNSSYAYSNGTSMSGPMVSGSVGLLLEHQENLHPAQPLRSATMKGLILHTATDLGNAGPDYVYGWGLMNTQAAAAVMSANAANGIHIYEQTLAQGATYTLQVKATNEPLKVSLVWNDVPGTPVAASLNPADLMLVNDLDMVISGPASASFQPYILDPANPSNVATTGDNFRDNVEIIYIASPIEDAIYTITINHKGATLSGGSQAYSLIVTGNQDFDYAYLFNVSDNAGNYGGVWTNGSNQGNGFGAWVLGSGTNAGFAGHFIGDPATAGISGMDAASFGLFSNPYGPGNFALADRPFAGPLSIGSTFSVDWGVNWDSNGLGNKGINLYTGGTSGTQIININMGGSSAITINGNPMFNNYGTNPMTLHFEYVSAGNLRVYGTGRDGSESYDETIAVAGAPDAVRFYSSDLDGGDARQAYFNNLQITTDFNDVPANSDAIAAGDLTINANLTLDNLLIETGNSVTVNAANTLTVNGGIDNQAGAAALVLQSNTTGTASLMHTTNDVPATQQRYISGNGYHGVSVPLTAASNPLSGIYMGSYLFYYDQPTQSFVSNGTSTTTPLDVTRGYFLYYPDASTTYNYTGNLNNGSFTANTSHHTVGDYTGYNLVPNPYPSAIDWLAATGWTKTNINNSIWVWNPVNGNYSSYINGAPGVNGGSQYIAAGQAFFVQSNNASPVLTMDNNVRLHNAQAFLKDGEPFENALRISLDANDFRDEMIIRFDDEATASYDPTDVQKLYGNADAPQFYSYSDDQVKLSINSLDPDPETRIVQLGLELTGNHNLQFELEGGASFITGHQLMLEDQLTNTFVDLSSSTSYAFTKEEGDDLHRFRLHITGVTATHETIAQSEMKAWYDGKQLYLQLPESNTEQLQLEIYSVLGSLLDATVLKASSVIVHPLHLSGAVMLKVTAGSKVYSTKLFTR